MGLSVGHVLLVLLIILILFGAGRLPQVMRDMAKGMRAFRQGMHEEETEVAPLPPLNLRGPAVSPDAQRSGRVAKPASAGKKPLAKVVPLKASSKTKTTTSTGSSKSKAAKPTTAKPTASKTALKAVTKSPAPKKAKPSKAVSSKVTAAKKAPKPSK